MKKRALKFIACFLAINLLSELVFPVAAYALTNGPSQPEVESFEPITTNQMVDLFSGDFTYNIPLIDVGGYPINIHYNGNVTMEQEASWVGLGWNINPGVIQRNIQGIPDDFNGDAINTEHHMKPSIGVTLNAQLKSEFFGKDSKLAKLNGANFSILYNNYKGIGFGVSKSVNVAESSSWDEKNGATNIHKLDLGLSYNSFSGIGIDPTYSREVEKCISEYNDKGVPTYMAEETKGFSVGLSYSSMHGLSGLSFNRHHHTSSATYMEKNDAANKYKMGLKSGVNGGVGISFLNQVFSPSIRPDMTNLSITLGGSFGKELMGKYDFTNFGLNVSVQGVSKTERAVSSRAFGSYFVQNINPEEEKVMMDAYNENAASITKNTIFLQHNLLAKDVLVVNGQGISGVYTPHRSQVGTYIPQYSKMLATQNIGGLVQFGIAEKLKLGVDANFDIVTGHSGLWKQNNNLYEYANYNVGNGQVDFEPIYFKNSGEKSKVRNAWAEELDSNWAIAPNMDFNIFRSQLNAQHRRRLNGSSTQTKDIGNALVSNEREARNQHISILNKSEVLKYGLLKYAHPDAEDHHYAEITVTNPDGGRYIYATPVYNTLQKEVSFSVGGVGADNSYSWSYNPAIPMTKKHGNGNADPELSGLVRYFENSDNTLDNHNGTNELFNAKTLPPHAYSYLLNAIVSSDYQDVDGDGPSATDYGSYVLINYKQTHSNYKWRTPVYQDSAHSSIKYANLGKCLSSDPNDDMATYMYGEKEIRYIETIRTKTHIAVFYTSPRLDAYEAKDENGGVDWTTCSSMHKLDSIKVYTIDEYENIDYLNEDFIDRTPIKCVYFEYDYSLCPNTPNSQAPGKGKLTLKSISFSFSGNLSKVGKYEFDYGQGAQNPGYNRLANDRWGYYKVVSTDNEAPEPPEFPYVDQNTNTAGTWALNKITLPSGGSIDIEYEQDDYAYVMDREAMFMTKVVGQREDPNSQLAIDNQLYNTDQNRPYIIFAKDPAIGADKYVGGLKYVYFNYYVNLKEYLPGNSEAYEYISGYARIESFGECNDPAFGYVKVKGEKYDQFSAWENASPMALAAWQYTLLNVPEIAFPSSNTIKNVNQGSFADFVKVMVSPLSELMKAVAGYNRSSRVLQRAKIFDPNKSSIRLLVPDGKKKGGGNRVKTIKFSDNWSQLSGNTEPTESFGQRYIYELEDGRSSGVASYEPNIGNDENPYHVPGINGNIENLIRQSPLGINYGNNEEVIERNFLGFNKRQWLDIPIMEQYFSGAQVGYSRVQVRNLTSQEIDQNNPSTNQNGTGYQVTEFYTAKDYPTRWNVTDMDLHVLKNQNANITDFLGMSFGKAGATQGFSVVLNDMHGKLKGTYSYDNYTNLITGVTYKYRSRDGKPETKELDNRFPVILPDGSVEYQALVGYEMETMIDPREMEQSTSKFQLHFDLDMFSIGVIPAIVAGIPLRYSYQRTETKSASMTKLIRQYGLLEEITAFDNGANITTRNLALDAETGEVLVTSTQNEYSDLIYNVTLPAHWTYSGMGMAYKNANLKFSASVNNGIASVNNSIGELLEPGDELVTEDGSIGNEKSWILDTYNTGSNWSISIIDKDGASVPDGTYLFRILRSGKRNLQNMSIGKLVMKTNPLKHDAQNWALGTLDISNESNDYKVLNASAITYSDIWQLYQFDNEKYVTTCIADNIILVNSKDFTNPGGEYLTDYINGDTKWFFKPGDEVNPYYTGIRGQWKPKESYVYFDQTSTANLRTSAKGVPAVMEDNKQFNQTDMRNDGELVDYAPFWRLQGSGLWKSIKELTPAKDPWIAPAKTTQIGQKGYEQESVDALGIYSSALYSGITGLPYAVAQNAKLRNILNENFEDYLNQFDYGFQCEVDQENEWEEGGTTYHGFNLKVMYNSFHLKQFGKQLRAPQHWFIWPRLSASSNYWLSTDFAHSGKKSLEIKSGNLEVKVPIYGATQNSNSGLPRTNFTLNQQDLVDVFSPIPSNSDNDGSVNNRTYILSYWIRAEDVHQDLTGAKIELGSIMISPINGQTTGTVVEGWVKREYEFSLPSGVNYLDIQFVNSGDDPVYFDDLRIQPKESLMKTFVYDRYTLRLVATLDENNFATFFEYDSQGRLIRTKRETERGIVTISENRSHILH